ncbi:DnaA inactivator Hda [Frischella sp. Ac48]|nr:MULTISPECIES: DnaA inactivator Hda [Frischella]MBX4132584.1 DnaA inactivator Hda [Frischella sp. Ac48]
MVLPVSLPDTETFASFYTGYNELLINYLKAFLNKTGFHSLYFWANASSGRTHLLHAACHDMSLSHKLISYIPLEQYLLLTPDILVGLENYDLVCLDNIDHIAGNKQWEEAIFDLFNRLLENSQAKLLITGNHSPKQIPFSLPDLVSRLEWGQVYQLKELSDGDKLNALQLRAKLRGFELSTDVGLFLLKRVDRDMRSLFNLLDKLDKATITEQRKLTIPFIKAIVNL